MTQYSKYATKSNLILSSVDGDDISNQTINRVFDLTNRNVRLNLSDDFVISKNDVQPGNKIVLGTIQTASNLRGNLTGTDHVNEDGVLLYIEDAMPFTELNWHGTDIGEVRLFKNDNSEFDLVLTVKNRPKNLASDVTGNINLTAPLVYNVIYNAANSLKGITDTNPYKSILATPDGNGSLHKYFTTINIGRRPEPMTTHDLSYDNKVYTTQSPQYSEINKMSWMNGFQQNNSAGYNYMAMHNGQGLTPRNEVVVIKVTGTNLPTDLTTATVKPYFYLINADKQPTMELVADNDDPESYHALTKQKVEDYLTPEQLAAQVKPGCAARSEQKDGSVLFAANVIPEDYKKSDAYITHLIKRSVTYGISNDNERNALIQRTLSFYHNMNNEPFVNSIRMGGDVNPNLVQKFTMTDVTPSSYKVVPGNSTTSSHAPNGGNINAETFRSTHVLYIDTTNKNNTVKTDDVQGLKDQSSNYSVSLPKGFQLSLNQPIDNGSPYTWSSNKKTISYHFNDNQKVNDDHPIKIYLTHGTHTTNDTSGVGSRTITYSGAPGVDKSNTTQKVQFTRENTTDDVTGKVTPGTWKPEGNGKYPAKDSPVIPGYIASQKSVPAVDAHQGDRLNINITYSKAPQSAKLIVHDDTTNVDLPQYGESANGSFSDPIKFVTVPPILESELEDLGYTIVSDSFKGSPTYNSDNNKNTFIIHVTHKIVPVTPDKPKKPTDTIPDTKRHYPTGVDTNDLNHNQSRTITYKYEDGTQAQNPVEQNAHFTRTAEVDAVTQKIVKMSDWSTKDTYPEVATKSIDGYTPDKDKIKVDTPRYGANQDQAVVYNTNDEDAAITYIDDTTGKVLKNDTEKAKYKQAIKFATDPNTQIQTYKDQGYVLVSSDWKDGSTYQTDPARNKFTVHLKHGTSTVTPDKPKKTTDIIPGTKQHYPKGVDQNDLNQNQSRKITYQFSDTKKQAQDPVTQNVTFHRTATVDNVTGKTTYTDWATSDQYPEVDTKPITGYTPDKSKVIATKPVLNTNQDVQVNYNANDQSATITYIDDDNGGKAIKTDNAKGKFNQVINFATDPNTEVKDLQSKGYVEGKSNYTTGTKYNSDNSKNNFTIHFTHKKVNVNHDKPKKPTDTIPDTNQHYPKGVDTSDLNKDQTRTITYTYADSKKEAQPNVVQKVTFHRDATVDAVTGKTTYTDWKTTDQYPAVKSKDITGYTPDKPEITVATPKLDKNQDEHVTYNPNDETVKVIAQDPNGKTLDSTTINGKFGTDYHAKPLPVKGYHLIKEPGNKDGKFTTSNKDIIFVYKPDKNTVPQQTDGTPKPDKSSYPSDLTPGKRQKTLPETGTDNTTLSSALAIASLGVLLPMSAVLKTRKNK